MNKGLYALAGVILALVVSSIIGQFFSGLVIGLVIGYSLCDKGEMLAAVWTKVHPRIDSAFARIILLAGLKFEDHPGPGNPRLPSKGSDAKLANLKGAEPTSRRKRGRLNITRE